MKRVALGQVAEIQRVGVDPAELDPDTRYIGLEHVERGGRIASLATVGTSSVKSTKFRFTPEHLLYGKLRPNLGKIARPSESGVCSTDILPVLPGPDLDRGYLFHYLSQPTVIALAASQATGANLPRLSFKALERLEIPLPPLDEQRRIAATLDRADSLRARHRQIAGCTEELPQSIFSQMFGDPTTNTRNWPVMPLREVITSIDSGASPVCESRPAQNDEWGVLKLGAVSYGVFRPDENKAFLGDVTSIRKVEVKPGDLLFSRKNTKDLVGAVAIVHDVPPRRLLPDLIFRLNLRTDRATPEYMHALLSNPRKRSAVVALASGSASSMSNISQSRLAALPIELPPLQLQEDFAHRMREVQLMWDRCEQASAIYSELFASLQARAFAGQL